VDGSIPYAYAHACDGLQHYHIMERRLRTPYRTAAHAPCPQTAPRRNARTWRACGPTGACDLAVIWPATCASWLAQSNGSTLPRCPPADGCLGGCWSLSERQVMGHWIANWCWITIGRGWSRSRGGTSSKLEPVVQRQQLEGQCGCAVCQCLTMSMRGGTL